MKKAILDFDGYQMEVFENGDIYRVARIFYTNTGKKYNLVRKKLTPHDNGNGYWAFAIYSNHKTTNLYVHRIVGLAFIPNPNNLPEINHKNGIRSDNRIENLEWITRIGNVRDYIIKGRAFKKKKKCVLQFDLNGIFVAKHECLLDAAKIYNTSEENLRSVTLNVNNTAVGYFWIYEELYDPLVHTSEYIAERVRKKNKKTVYKYSKSLEYIETYDSVSAASNEINNINKPAVIAKISSCCLGRIRWAYGFKYSYEKF